MSRQKRAPVRRIVRETPLAAPAEASPLPGGVQTHSFGAARGLQEHVEERVDRGVALRDDGPMRRRVPLCPANSGLGEFDAGPGEIEEELVTEGALDDGHVGSKPDANCMSGRRLSVRPYCFAVPAVEMPACRGLSTGTEDEVVSRSSIRTDVRLQAAHQFCPHFLHQCQLGFDVPYDIGEDRQVTALLLVAEIAEDLIGPAELTVHGGLDRVCWMVHSYGQAHADLVMPPGQFVTGASCPCTAWAPRALPDVLEECGRAPQIHGR
jgi:hypothetical protein